MLRPLLLYVTAGALLFTAAACSNSSLTGPEQNTAVAVETLTRSSPDSSKTLAQGTWGGYDFEERQNIVIDDPADFEAFWNALHNGDSTPAPPEVNFSEVSVVAVLLGLKRSGGYRIEVEDVSRSGGQATVHVVETRPGRTCPVSDAFTSPYHIVSVDARPDDFTFESEQVATSCQ